jgi:hypothetical protein|tara:strand:- start:521 stop:697 length:177 start_codon:yes stop_codon:yes gene_type:complete
MRGKKARMLRQVASTVDGKGFSKSTNHLTNEKGQIILGACTRKIYKLLKKGQQNEKEI